jgi:hypothetical protein
MPRVSNQISRVNEASCSENHWNAGSSHITSRWVNAPCT